MVPLYPAKRGAPPHGGVSRSSPEGPSVTDDGFRLENISFPLDRPCEFGLRFRCRNYGVQKGVDSCLIDTQGRSRRLLFGRFCLALLVQPGRSSLPCCPSTTTHFAGVCYEAGTRPDLSHGVALMFGALVGAVAPALIGGLLTRNDNRRAAAATAGMNRTQRNWQLKDMAKERHWFEKDRIAQYNRENILLADARADQDARTLDQRAHDAQELDRQVASRGVDFQKLRDQAQAAGFNPLTVLGNSGLYSTERGAALGSGASSGVSLGGGGGVSFASSGRGFTAATAPVLSSGSFVQDALHRGLDTFFNTPEPVDPLAEALRSAMQTEQVAEEAKRTQVPKGFGYDLTVNRPFEAAAVSGLPPVSAASSQVAVGRPKPNPSKQTFINVRFPDGQMGQLDGSIARRLDIQPYDTVSAGDWAEIRGEVVGETETTLQFDPIARTSIRRTGIGGRLSDPPPSPKVRNTKPPKMRDPNPQPGWMDEFFR